MLRMGLAPCSPFTVTNNLMTEAATLARKYPGVRLHTHLAENQVWSPAHLCLHGLCRFSMLRIGLAPCAPFNVTNDLMIATAKLARQYQGVRLHTHLAENQVPGPPS